MTVWIIYSDACINEWVIVIMEGEDEEGRKEKEDLPSIKGHQILGEEEQFYL